MGPGVTHPHATLTNSGVLNVTLISASHGSSQTAATIVYTTCTHRGKHFNDTKVNVEMKFYQKEKNPKTGMICVDIQ